MLCVFWILWKAWDQRFFESKEISYQAEKPTFLCNLVSRIRYIDGESLTMIDVVDWLGSFVFVAFSFFFFTFSLYFLSLEFSLKFSRKQT